MNEFSLQKININIINLIDTITAENDLLRDFKIQEIYLNQTARDSAIVYLSNASKYLAEHTEEYKQSLDPIIDDIKHNMLELNKLMITNNMLISRALEINKKIVSIVANQFRKKNPSYNNMGKFQIAKNENKPIAVVDLV